MGWRFVLPRGTVLSIVPAGTATSWLPGSLLPPLPGIAAVSFTLPDMQAQAVRLKAAGFTVAETGGRLVVPAEEACGLAVIFTS